MDVTAATWTIAILGILLMTLLGSMQTVAVLKPRGRWTIDNVYGGNPEATDEVAYFAFNQGYARADVFLWAPLQFLGSIGMLFGQRWGFLLALVASVPYVYTAITIFHWDRDLGFQQRTLMYWLVIWGMWPAFGVLQGIYCFARLVS